MTAWTSDSGAMAIAATCRAHAPKATSMPIANQRERNRAAPLRSGWCQSTSGAAQAPRCL